MHRSLEKELAEGSDQGNSLLQTEHQDALLKVREELEEKQREEEENLRRQMKEALAKLENEVQDLHKEEQSRLEDEKKKALDRLQRLVEDATANEQKRLEQEKKQTLESMQAKHKLEMDRLTDDMERKHKENVNELKETLSDRHEQDIKRMKEELKRLQDQETKEMEQELEAAKQRQKAIDDLEKGLDEVLNERRQELKQQHQKELTRLREEHSEQLRKLREEYKEKEYEEKKLIEQNFDAERRKLQKQHEKDMDEVRREFTRKKDTLSEQLEAEMIEFRADLERRRQEMSVNFDKEEEELQEKRADYERKKIEMDKSLKNMETQEKKLEERRKRFKEDRDKFEDEQDEAFANRTVKLSANEIERMKEERKQLNEELRAESEALEQVKSERRTLEGDILKMKLTRDTSFRKLDDLKDKIERKNQELESAQQKLIDAAEEEKTIAEERLRSSYTERKHLSRDSDEEATPRDLQKQKRKGRPVAKFDDDDLSVQEKKIWDDLLSDDSLAEDLPILPKSHHGGLKEQVSKETNALSISKEFLRKQRHSLKRRQAALQAAKQELTRDVLRQKQGNLSPGTAHVLDDVRLSLEREAMELDNMTVQMNTGTQLLKEKERHLRKLKNRAHNDLHYNSDSDVDWTPFEHNYRPARLPNFDLSDDDESSGISSTDNSVDNVLQALHRQNDPIYKSATSLVSNGLPSDRPEGNQVNDPLARSLVKINTELSRVIKTLGSNSTRSTPVPDHQTPVATPSGDTPGPSYNVPVYQNANSTLGSSLPIQAWTPNSQPSNQVTNPYIYNPQHRVDYASVVHNAEQSLERKWRKYFGDRKPPFTSATGYVHSSGVTYGHTPVREQLRQFRSSLLDVPNTPSVPPPLSTLSQDRLSPLPALDRPALGMEKFSTDERLAEQKEWLRKFQQDLSFGASLVKAPGSDAGSVNSLVADSEHKEPVSSSTPTKPPDRVRLELDENDEIRVRKY